MTCPSVYLRNSGQSENRIYFALVWTTLLFGFLAVLTFNQQIRNLFS